MAARVSYFDRVIKGEPYATITLADKIRVAYIVHDRNYNAELNVYDIFDNCIEQVNTFACGHHGVRSNSWHNQMFSPDGEYITGWCLSNYTYCIRVWKVASCDHPLFYRFEFLHFGNESLLGLSWSPMHNQIMFVTEEHVAMLLLENHTLCLSRNERHQSFTYVTSIQWAPKGDFFSLVSVTSDVWVFVASSLCWIALYHLPNAAHVWTNSGLVVAYRVDKSCSKVHLFKGFIANDSPQLLESTFVANLKQKPQRLFAVHKDVIAVTLTEDTLDMYNLSDYKIWDEEKFIPRLSVYPPYNSVRIAFLPDYHGFLVLPSNLEQYDGNPICRNMTTAEWSDREHQLYAPFFKRLVFVLMCTKSRLQTLEPRILPDLPMACWLNIFGHLCECNVVTTINKAPVAWWKRWWSFLF